MRDISFKFVFGIIILVMVLLFLPNYSFAVTFTDCSNMTGDTYINGNVTMNNLGTCNLNDTGIRGILIINSSNVVLDCGGTVFNGNATGYVVNQTQDINVTVKNCIFSNYSTAIYMTSSNFSIIENNTINYGTSNNIHVINSNNNTIANNTINLTSKYGIYLSNSVKNNLSYNNIIHNSGASQDGIFFAGFSNENYAHGNVIKYSHHGIDIDGVNFTIISDNVIESTNRIGIHLHAEAWNNTLRNNNVTNSTQWGVFSDCSYNTNYTMNNMSDNKWDFSVSCSSEALAYRYHFADTSNEVTGGKHVYWILDDENQTYDGSDIGVFACVNCKNVTLKNAVISRSENCVNIWNSSNIFINNITVSICAWADIILSTYSNHVVISNSTLTDSDNIGLHSSWNTYNVDIVNNVICNNTQHGIRLSNIENITVLNNNICSNSNRGVHVRGVNITVANNTIQSNANGVHLDAQNRDGMICNNTILSNTYGIYIDPRGVNSFNNTFCNNDVINSTLYGVYFEESTTWDNLMKDSLIQGNYSNSSYYDIVVDQGAYNNTFLNVTFNKSSVNIIDGSIFVKWYLDVLVKNFALDMINIATALISGESGLDVSDTTNNNGRVRFNITEYYQNGNAVINGSNQDNLTYYTPHNISVSKTGYLSNSTVTNMSTSKLITLMMFTLDYYSCSSSNECSNGYCVHGTCRSTLVWCGDGYCDSGETYGSCSQDCAPPKSSGVGYSCNNKWECSEWSECSSGVETRICEDMNDCSIVYNKPIETKICTTTTTFTCVENWECSEWSECVVGLHTRVCEDVNNCGTYENKPSIVQTCEISEGNSDYISNFFQTVDLIMRYILALFLTLV